MNTLVIRSTPADHRAHIGDKEYGPVPTEIALIELLQKNGIDIKDWKCVDCHGTDLTAISTWEKRNDT